MVYMSSNQRLMNHPNFSNISEHRKLVVESIVADLLRTKRMGTSHARISKLSDTECMYALYVGKPHRMKIETLQGLGKCLFCPSRPNIS